jgi:cGMP-inhibited 3',5'-cyclic phosphodiesterase A
LQSSTLSYDAAVMSEAHGIISDLLAVSNLPAQVVNGLRAVSTLLRPPSENHSSATLHRPKISPLLALSEASSYGSDADDLPYTGERPSTLPNVITRYIVSFMS